MQPAPVYKSMTLAQRLNAAREILGGGVAKGGRNKDQKYDYVKAADVSRAVYDALGTVGVYAVPSYEVLRVDPVTWTTSRGTQQIMAMLKVTLRVGKAEDRVGFSINTPQAPETMTVETIGFGADTGDKGPFKAMTGGLKYALLHLVGLATDDDPETEHEAPSMPAQVSVGPTNAPTQAAVPERVTAVGADPKAPVTPGQLKTIFEASTAAGLTIDQFKALVLLVTKKEKSQDLVGEEVDAILTALKDQDIVAKAKGVATQEQNFEATVGQTADPTADAEAEADRIAAQAAAITGGEVVQG